MKILLVTPHFGPRYIGGVETYTNRLASALRASGEDPEVLCVESFDSCPPAIQTFRDDKNGYPVHRLAGGIAIRCDVPASYDDPALQQLIGALLDDSKPDVLHLHSGYLLGGPALAAARTRRLPTIVTLHDFWFICPRINLLHPDGRVCSGPDNMAKCAWCLATEKRRYRLPDVLTRGALGRLVVAVVNDGVPESVRMKSRRVRALATRRVALMNLLASADLVLAPSQFVQDKMAQWGWCRERIEVLRFGIELPPRGYRRRVRREDRRIHIAYLGQIAPHKGVHVLLRAIRHLPGAEISVQVFGDLERAPKYAQHLRSIARLDPRVAFAGPYERSHVYDVLSESDLVVVPSLCDETLCLVALEAQAAGVPVVASRRGAICETIVHERNGLLFEPGDSRDLARQLARVANEPLLLARLAANAVRSQDVESEVRELRTRYRRLLTPARTA